MAELFKFRCSACEKLLGVSPKKAGRTVQCPQCGTELIVPSAVDDSPDPSDEIGSLGIDLGLGSEIDLRPDAPRPVDRASDEVEAIAFLEQSAATSESDPDPSSSVPSAEQATASTATDEAEPDDDLDAIVRTPIEPLIPISTRKRFEPSVDRRRDVVLPRTAVVAWSMFALFALALSFVAGLLIGHYRWK